MPFKTYFNWSTGKDSALALHYLLQNDAYCIDQLVTSINSHYNRVSMHGLRRELLEAQANAIGLSLTTIELPEHPSMEDYENIMHSTINRLKKSKYTHCAFGDIFLEDLKAYREQQLQKVNITPIFPLWKKNTTELLHDFLDLGFKAIIVCAKSEFFNEDSVGKVLTKELIKTFPKSVDVCGENGEFHTFCFDGPIFKTPVKFNIGDTVYKSYPTPNAKNEDTGFWYCDLLPNN